MGSRSPAAKGQNWTPARAPSPGGPTATRTRSFSPVARVGAKVSAAIEVPDEGDLTQHHSTAGHGEVGRCPQQVRAAQRLCKVPVLHYNGAWVQLRHHGLPVGRLQGGHHVSTWAQQLPWSRPLVSPILTPLSPISQKGVSRAVTQRGLSAPCSCQPCLPELRSSLCATVSSGIPTGTGRPGGQHPHREWFSSPSCYLPCSSPSRPSMSPPLCPGHHALSLPLDLHQLLPSPQ